MCLYSRIATILIWSLSAYHMLQPVPWFSKALKLLSQLTSESDRTRWSPVASFAHSASPKPTHVAVFFFLWSWGMMWDYIYLDLDQGCEKNSGPRVCCWWVWSGFKFQNPGGFRYIIESFFHGRHEDVVFGVDEVGFWWVLGPIEHPDLLPNFESFVVPLKTLGL